MKHASVVALATIRIVRATITGPLRCHRSHAAFRFSSMATESALPALQFSLSPERVKEEADAVVAECTARLDAIAAALTSGGASACTWERVVAPLAAMDRDLEPRVSALTFLKDASTDKVRHVHAWLYVGGSQFQAQQPTVRLCWCPRAGGTRRVRGGAGRAVRLRSQGGYAHGRVRRGPRVPRDAL